MVAALFIRSSLTCFPSMFRLDLAVDTKANTTRPHSLYEDQTAFSFSKEDVMRILAIATSDGRCHVQQLGSVTT